MLADLRARPGFVGLLASTTALGIAYSFTMPYLSLWAMHEIGLSPRQFGAFMTVTALCAILIGTTVARWSDLRLARRTALLLGAGGGACGYIGYAYCRAPLVLGFIAATFIALSTTCFPQLFAYVREIFTGKGAQAGHGPLLMSLVRVCFSVAWTAGPAVGGMVLLHYGFSGLFLAAAALYAAFLCGVLLFVPYKRPCPHPVAKLPVWRVLGRCDILMAFVAFLAVFAAHAVNMMNLPLMITRVLGGSTRDVGIAFGIGPLVEVPLMIWFGYLAGRGHTRRLIVIGAAVTVLYFALLGLSTEPWHVFLVQGLSGVSFAILTNVAILYFQDLLPGQAGLGTALFSNSGNAGNLVGFLAFGTLAEPLGSRGLFLPCCVMTLFALAIVTWLRPRDGSPPGDPDQHGHSAAPATP